MDDIYGIEGKTIEDLLDDYESFFTYLWYNKFSWINTVDNSIDKDDFLQICREQFLVTYNSYDYSYKKPFDLWVKKTLIGRVVSNLCVISKLLNTRIRGTGPQATGEKKPCYVQSLDTLMELYN